MISLPEERKDLIRKILPPADITPMDLYPLSHNADIWVLHVERTFSSWSVAGLFNWDSDGQEMLDSDMSRAWEILARNDQLLGTRHSWDESVLLCSRVENVAALNRSYDALPTKPAGLQLIPLPAAFAPIPAKKQTINFAKAGLEGGRSYLVFDFWNQKFIGKLTDTYSVELASHASQIVSFRPDLGRPQLVGTDRHVTMGAIEVQDEEWNQQAKRLRLTLNVVEHYPSNFTIYTGEYRFRDAHASSGADLKVSHGNLLVCCGITSATREADLTLHFA